MNPLDDAVAELIDREVVRAVQSYRWGCPGHGAYVLARLALKVERAERVAAEARDALAE